ncbi:hypothetical protein CH330_02475 [candidate division WOR-3 bacterium JGI_Cruoil_03_51_56]|uniref:Uncharacterized protein n=1 Tax=candidate division WOR-3 bacterium JGI_Cruoil_03_51_56 TaxID=1973747 RepID=A0A235BW18_UNCW3|nr:MAG: hypothetical protein CH330_02475 [candidate division WOR-3 bacterium JGI_Cruoil_03_51_56]
MRFGQVIISVLIGAGLVLFLVNGCGTEPPPRWPWWTAEDSSAVQKELGLWRDVFNPNHTLEGAMDSKWSSGLTFEDSTSETGDTLYKFAHLLSVSIEPTDSGHTDEFQFGVTVDTVAMKDTFCEVAYRDSMENCLAHFDYDSLWVVGFRPDTTIDTSVCPPETIIVQKVSYTELRGFGSPQRVTKSYNWSAFRKLFLSKDTSGYALTKATGFAVHVPSAEDAPEIFRVVLSRPGRSDTFFYSPREDGSGIYNLRPIDSLYAIEPDEEVQLEVEIKSSSDTSLFFVGIMGTKTEITVGPRRGEGTVAFAEVGYHHIYIEVLPLSNVFYPDADYTGIIWAIPVRVCNP